MAEYIEKGKLIDTLYGNDCITFQGMKLIHELPVMEVVRCKDCKFVSERIFGKGDTFCTPWCDCTDSATDEDGFCHLGERKEEWLS